MMIKQMQANNVTRMLQKQENLKNYAFYSSSCVCICLRKRQCFVQTAENQRNKVF